MNTTTTTTATSYPNHTGTTRQVCRGSMIDRGQWKICGQFSGGVQMVCDRCEAARRLAPQK